MLFFAFILIRFTPSIYSRLIEIQQTALTVPVGDQYNSTNIRVGILQCSWEVIQKNIILGAGVGSEKPLLNECYAKFETVGYKNVYYNTHNQYLNLWLIAGIASLILFIYSLFYAARTAIRVKDHLLLFFIILISLTFLTENVLSRHAGIVFFYFFLCLMMAYHKQTIDKSSTQYPSTTE
jgi:O-antigen ligase